MDDGPTEPGSLATVAERAVRAGGDYLADVFRAGAVEADYGTDDVKAAADRAAEERVLDVIRDAYPEHAIRAEESGRAGDHRYEWIVDPLDGTNNFAAGMSLFATAVCVLRDGIPLVTAIYEPLPESLYLARRGEGATINGDSLRAESDLSLSRGTVSYVVGLPALRDDAHRETADRIESAIDAECKRVLNTWSPCVDWGLLARGGIEGLVAYRPDVFEQYAGELLAAESGVQCRILDPATGEVIATEIGYDTTGSGAAPAGGDVNASVGSDVNALGDDDVNALASGEENAPGTSGVGNLYVGASDPATLDQLTGVVASVVEA